MRSDGLTFFGETSIRLYGIDYDMKFDIGTIQQFEQQTGKDFSHLAMQIIMMWTTEILPARIKRHTAQVAAGVAESIDLGGEAERLTSIISREEAARLFYLGAKAANSQVTFSEIQEGVMLDGPYRRKITDPEHEDYGDYTESYPLIFVTVVLMLQKEAYDDIKKKPTAKTALTS